ncbi:hypothetical protein [Ruegeria sp. HKCCSP335]|uniref:hypothetical protein n=1 Tax=Ruegeria sp. HKCCSP335 TaxID=2794833 RepID=UPI001AE1C871|nr:hypothetical protein [Ruegeria sp. HKCCSP335]
MSKFEYRTSFFRALVFLVTSSLAHADHALKSGYYTLENGEKIPSGITQLADNPYGSEKVLVDVDSIDFNSLGLLSVRMFNETPSIAERSTGDQFADKRANDAAQTELLAAAEALYHEVNQGNLVFVAHSVPVELGKYNFQNQSFAVCLPGTWSNDNGGSSVKNVRGLTFLMPRESGYQCESVASSYTNRALKGHEYAYNIVTVYPRIQEQIAEQFLQATKTQPFVATIFCGRNFSKMSGGGLACTVARVKLYLNGDEVWDAQFD